MSGCGSAVLAAGFPALGIGFLGVSLAFGLTVLTMAYAVGHISGGHFNCAVTIGLWAGGPFKASDVIPYIIAQVAGAIVAAAVLYAIASGKPDWVADGIPIGLCLTLSTCSAFRSQTRPSTRLVVLAPPCSPAAHIYQPALALLACAPCLGAALAGFVGRWQHGLVDTPST